MDERRINHLAAGVMLAGMLGSGLARQSRMLIEDRELSDEELEAIERAREERREYNRLMSRPLQGPPKPTEAQAIRMRTARKGVGNPKHRKRAQEGR